MAPSSQSIPDAQNPYISKHCEYISVNVTYLSSTYAHFTSQSKQCRHLREKGGNNKREKGKQQQALQTY